MRCVIIISRTEYKFKINRKRTLHFNKPEGICAHNWQLRPMMDQVKLNAATASLTGAMSEDLRTHAHTVDELTIDDGRTACVRSHRHRR